jgi:hypothetical protein
VQAAGTGAGAGGGTGIRADRRSSAVVTRPTALHTTDIGNLLFVAGFGGNRGGTSPTYGPTYGPANAPANDRTPVDWGSLDEFGQPLDTA